MCIRDRGTEQCSTLGSGSEIDGSAGNFGPVAVLADDGSSWIAIVERLERGCVWIKVCCCNPTAITEVERSVSEALSDGNEGPDVAVSKHEKGAAGRKEVVTQDAWHIGARLLIPEDCDGGSSVDNRGMKSTGAMTVELEVENIGGRYPSGISVVETYQDVDTGPRIINRNVEGSV